MHYSKHKSSVLSNIYQTFLSQWVIVLNHEGLKTKTLPLCNLLAQFNWGFDICNQEGVSPICMNVLKQVTGKNRTSQERIGTFFQSQTIITILHQKVYSLITNEQALKSEYTMKHQPRLLNRPYTFKFCLWDKKVLVNCAKSLTKSERGETLAISEGSFTHLAGQVQQHGYVSREGACTPATTNKANQRSSNLLFCELKIGDAYQCLTEPAWFLSCSDKMKDKMVTSRWEETTSRAGTDGHSPFLQLGRFLLGFGWIFPTFHIQSVELNLYYSSPPFFHVKILHL